MKKFQKESGGGLPGWMATYGDLVTLLLCFFVLLFSMSSIDVAKFKAAMSSFANQIDIMPGGIALTGEELITNGVSQLNEIKIILENKNPTAQDSTTTDHQENDSQDVNNSNNQNDTSNDTGNNISKTKAIAQDMKAYLAEKGIASDVEVSYSSDYVKLTIEGEILFDLSKADLKPEAIGIMDDISDMIISKEYENYTIQIDGHTDDWQIHTVQYPSNWYLSAARAIAVGEMFINKYNFSPDIIACTGYGEYSPIADNSTAEGRAENRRVEIKLLFQADEVIQPDVVVND